MKTCPCNNKKTLNNKKVTDFQNLIKYNVYDGRKPKKHEYGAECNSGL